MKLYEFIEQTNIEPSLVRAVVRNIGGWAAFKEQARDVTKYGAGNGFCNFVYYADTVAFTKRHKKAIITLCEYYANEFGTGLMEMVANFNCLTHLELTPDEVAKAIYTGKGDDVTQIYNALAWFALEVVARAYTDIEEG